MSPARWVALATVVLLGCGTAGPVSPRAGSGLPPELRAARGPGVEVPLAPAPPADLQLVDETESETGTVPPQGMAEPRRVGLEDVVAAARREPATVLAAAARSDGAAGRQHQALGGLLPSVTADAGAAHLNGAQVGSFGEVQTDLSFTTWDAGVGARWELNPGAAVARVIAAGHAARAAELRVEETRRQAALAAAALYYDLVLAQAAVEIARQRERDAVTFRDIARSRAASGVDSEADVARAEGELAQARTAYVRATEALDLASISLATLLRWNPASPLRPREQLLRPLTLVAAERPGALLAEARASRADVAAAREATGEADSRATAAWLDVFAPELSAGARERLVGVDPDAMAGTTLAHVLVGVSIGFDEVGRAEAEEAEARARLIEQRAAAERADADVLESLAVLRAAESALVQAERAVEAAERGYSIQRARFEAGTGLGLEVVAAQRALARARLDLVQAVVRYNTGQLRLAGALGHLDPAVLADSPP